MNIPDMDGVRYRDRVYCVRLVPGVSGQGRSHYLESPNVIDLSKVDISTISNLSRYYELLDELSKLTGKVIVTSVQKFSQS